MILQKITVVLLKLKGIPVGRTGVPVGKARTRNFSGKSLESPDLLGFGAGGFLQCLLLYPKKWGIPWSAEYPKNSGIYSSPISMQQHFSIYVTFDGVQDFSLLLDSILKLQMLEVRSKTNTRLRSLGIYQPQF